MQRESKFFSAWGRSWIDEKERCCLSRVVGEKYKGESGLDEDIMVIKKIIGWTLW